jgi:hypothetical protein
MESSLFEVSIVAACRIRNCRNSAIGDSPTSSANRSMNDDLLRPASDASDRIEWGAPGRLTIAENARAI